MRFMKGGQMDNTIFGRTAENQIDQNSLLFMEGVGSEKCI